jgi:hypothetical protein
MKNGQGEGCEKCHPKECAFVQRESKVEKYV